MIIGFTGKKRSGKSTASEYVMQLTGGTRINFKDALVEEITNLFPDLLNAIIDTMDVVAYDGVKQWDVKRLFEEKPPLVRRLMQNYGTNVCRGDDSFYWVKRWKEKVAETTGVIIVDDVRFLNEARAVRDAGGIIIRIEREGLESEDTHQSEVEMDYIEDNFCISVKTGDFNTLYQELNKIIYDGEWAKSTPHNNLLITHPEGI